LSFKVNSKLLFVHYSVKINKNKKTTNTTPNLTRVVNRL